MVNANIFLLVLALCACTSWRSHSSTPQTAAPRNEAIIRAKTLAKQAGCVALRTGEPKQADTAVCDLGQVIAYCYAGEGLGSDCLILADLRPKQPEAPKPPPPPTVEDALKKSDPVVEKPVVPDKPPKPEPKKK